MQQYIGRIMANLNIPFLLLQKDTCDFRPTISASALVHHSKFNLRESTENRQQQLFQGLQRNENTQNQDAGLLAYLGNAVSSVFQGGEGEPLSTKQLRTPIPFETSKPNLLVLADANSGTIALCSHETLETLKTQRRLLCNIQPRMLLVPSISQGDSTSTTKVGPLLAHCMVRCPAPTILSASTFWLCTLHSDRRVRLWNTDDGRCIAISPPQLFAKSREEDGSLVMAKPVALCALQGYPGHIFVFCEEGDLFIVNAYKMHVAQRVILDRCSGFASCEYLPTRSTLVLCDSKGAVYMISDSNGSANRRSLIDEYAHESEAASQSQLSRQTTGIQEETKSSARYRSTVINGSSTAAAGQKKLLNFCRKDKHINLKFVQNLKVGGRESLEVKRLKQSQVLAFNFDTRTKSVAIVVCQDRIEQVLISAASGSQQRKPYHRQALLELTEDQLLVFAAFIHCPATLLQYLVTIDKHLTVHVYDMSDLERPKDELTEEESSQFMFSLVQPVHSFELLQNCKVTDYHQIWVKDTFFELTSDQKTKEQHLQQRLDRLKEHLLEKFEEISVQNADLPVQGQSKASLFSYNRETGLLYSFVDVSNKSVLLPQHSSLMLTWDLTKGVNERLTQPAGAQSEALSLSISSLDLFTSQSKQGEPILPNSLIPFNPQVLKQFYNSSQFKFFFTDEKVTADVIWQDKISPSLIIGTNYGRVFVVPMFQEQQFRHVLPSILIDSHKGSPIKMLYLAYQGALHGNEDGGGHLVSVSEDGTVAATDLKSDKVAQAMHAKGPNLAQTSGKRRTDQFLHEKSKNMRQQRRHSVSQYFSADDFFKFERVRADEVYEELVFSPIKHVFRVKSFEETTEYLLGGGSQAARQKQQGSRLELPKQYYALVTEENEVALLTISPLSQSNLFTLTKLPLFQEPTIGVYLDAASQSLWILTESLSWRQYNLRSHSLSHRKRTFVDALNMLEVPSVVEKLVLANEHFFKVMAAQDTGLLSFENFQKDLNKARLLKGLGTHQCLDFLNLSLSTPITYAPQPHQMKKFTLHLSTLLGMKADILSFNESQDSQKAMLRAVNQVLNWSSDRTMHSDVSRKQAAVTAMDAHICSSQGSDGQGGKASSRQQVLIASTQDMLPVLQAKMKKCKMQRETPMRFNDYFSKQDGVVGSSATGNQRPRTEAANSRRGADPANGPLLINTKAAGGGPNPERQTQSNSEPQVPPSIGLDKYRWPAKILGLVHPFSLHDGMDESLEEFFNMNMAFLDFRMGVQGIDQAFSFVLSKEDRNYHNERDHITKIMGLLRLSREIQRLKATCPSGALTVDSLIEQHIDPQDSTLYLGRFFNSEYWKISPYVSTIIPAFLLSVFVSIIEYDEKEICLLSQVWLDIVHHIRHGSRFKQTCASPLKSPTVLSASVLSQLLLMQDLNVSSCAKDIIFKPMLCHQTDHDKKELQAEISDWLALVIDTYVELKEETTARPEDSSSQHASASNQGKLGGEEPAHQIMRMDSVKGDNPFLAAQQHGSNDLDPNSAYGNKNPTEQRPLSHFFGELEIKGLINVSFYAFYCQVEMNLHLGQRDLDRVSKLVVILIREVVQQFQDRKDYIHLLTILLYLLQCNLKTATANFRRKAIMEDVVRLLLFIFNYYKPPLNRELFITRVTSENFNLIRPTNSELYLKLVAAKTLLEIGVSFTEEFLQLIQFHATTLRPSHEHQKNVLETLRYFINGYGENLEKYLIQIVQILLRCLDPNELALRKNSHKYVSVILSNMVKIFPMVAFHYDTQRLAVGTHDGPIGIYDVRTSAKWKILEGHTKNITCLCFDSKGNYLASYSAIDLTLKLWKVGNTSFFATIMGGTGRHAKQIKLQGLGSHVPNPHIHKTQGANHVEMEKRAARFQDQNDISRGLNQDNEGGAAQGASAQGAAGPSGASAQSNANAGNRISQCHIRFMRGDKDVELIREDGSKELHCLIK